MGERKIKIRQMPDGTWAASADGWLDFLAMAAKECGSATVALEQVPYVGLVIVGTTPWEVSADVHRETGACLPIEWETLPWPTLREAHGIVAGVTHILGASLEARRAIDAANYEEEMRELGVSCWVTLTAKERAELAAAAAERGFLRGRDPERTEAIRALKWTRVASVWLPGYASAARLMATALANGYPERLRGRRLMRRAWSKLVAANARNDIAPDSR